MQQRYADLGLTKKVTGIVLKCACLGASKYPNLHFKLRFPVIYSMQNYNFLPSSLNLKGPSVDAKSSKFLSYNFSRYNFEKLIRNLSNDLEFGKGYWQQFLDIKKNFKKKLYDLFLWMGFNCLKYRATSRRQFTFYH